ncbi:MAG: ABC transporter ATP-binding protein [Granulosicoccus sp.]
MIPGNDSETTPVVLANNVGKRFGDRWVLQNANLKMMPGDSIALLGESGAGKSTLLNLLAGLEPLDEGTIQVAGHTLSAGNFDADATALMRRLKIGFVFQAFHLLPHLSVWQNVALPLLLNGLKPIKARPVAMSLLDRVNLHAYAEKRPVTLSGGEQQRVSLARALVHSPKLLLADEPTGNLDPETAGVALQLMQEIVADTGCALLMVTHSTQAAAICNSQLMLARGQLNQLA